MSLKDEQDTVSLYDLDMGTANSDAFYNAGFSGGESQDQDLTSSEAFAGQGFLQDEVGNAYKLDSSGNLTFKDSKGTDFTYNSDKGGFTDKDGNFAGGNNSLLDYVKQYGSKAIDLLKTNGKFDPAKLATLGIGAYALSKRGSDTGGYNKPVPKMDAIQQRVAYDDTNRRPGQGGRQYLTNPLFVAQGDTENMTKALAASNEQAAGLAAAAPKYAAPPPNPYAGKIPIGSAPSFTTGASDKTEAGKAAEYNALRSRGFSDVAIKGAADKQFGQQTQSDWNYLTNLANSTANAGLNAVITPEQFAAQGGIKMAAGGVADAGRYLQGKTDGMADEIETSIDGEQPALLSHGEFVIPADVVSHLGNGNSEAGAEKLYSMMDKIREARTGTKEQGKEINADKFLAAASGGLAAAYAGGGEVLKFQNGGVTPNPTATGAGGAPLDVSRTSTLSPWVGDYVTNALGQGAAMANQPYQAYQGPLTAGASNLQQQAFAGASDLASAGYTPGSFTGGFNASTANQYINPYLQASLDPQLKELQRQSDIQRVADAGRLTGAGAYGGGRQAIMESEGRRNLLDKQAGLIGSGYKSAYDTGLGQFNKEREADETSRQFSANYGLKSVDQLANLGNVERGITSEGLAADKAQFQEERDFGYKMPQYQLGLLSGLPIGSNTTAANQDAISKMSSDIAGLGALYQNLAKLKLA